MRLRAVSLLFLPILAPHAYADSILQTAAAFAVMGGSTVTNTGPTTIDGNLGVFPGTAITGAGSIVLNGTMDLGGAVAQQAQSDLTNAYNGLAAMPVTDVLTGKDLGGLTLAPGVYEFNSSAQLTGILTLDAEGNDNAGWVFLIGSTLITASSSDVTFINLGSNPNDTLFWNVGSSATLGTGTAFAGNILASQSITLGTGATIDCGRALAQTGAVTMDSNTVSIGCQGTGLENSNGLSGGNTPPVPEPGSATLFGVAALALAGVMRCKHDPRCAREKIRGYSGKANRLA
jgi:type VI secretion system secreted protein VgrG